MIVVDENLHDQRIMSAIAAWYSGRVVSITSLRPQSVIKDDSITTLLHRIHQLTFITINVADFWKKVEPHQNYCFVSFALPKERASEIPSFLHRLFLIAIFRTKAARMGKVVRVTPTRIEYYESDRRIQVLLWRE